ncbi:MAG TPA: TonB-dependent receptor [Terriglobales bacterium]|nr:TonB-dependent receptor [Terriglobales bacterium]
MRLRRSLQILLAVNFLSCLALAQQVIKIDLRDATGAAIPNAHAKIACSGYSRDLNLLESDPTVRIPGNASDCQLAIHAEGFRSKLLQIQPRTSALEVVLVPGVVQQSVTVTASRSPLAPADLPITETTFTGRELVSNPSVTVDDKLRQLPSFSLFRRSGSQTANPTTQGVSLRGLGASGASRSLVLEDGIPINDPFGSWIYWGRVPVQGIEQVDIVEGGTSDLYGSSALGGVINVRTRAPQQTALFAESSFGSSATPLGSAGLSLAQGPWNAFISGEAFKTNGYIPVAPDERGTVDTPAASRHQNGSILIGRSLQQLGSIFLRGSLFGESRENGTPLQINSTTIRQLSTGADLNTAAGVFTLRAYGGTQALHQTFSAVSSDRNSEFLTTDQRVPVHQYGFSAQWSKVFRGKHVVTSGIDGRDITGDTNELQFVSGAPNAYYIAGGRQQSYGFYLADSYQLTSRWMLSASVRADLWRNIDASSRRIPFRAATTVTPFENRSEWAFSPRVGLTRRVSSRASLHASVYRSFRAPTLNELYRPFRVGNVLTQANANLGAEHFTGGEVGSVVSVPGDVILRGTFFAGVLDGLVGNITLNTTPTLITRQRQNLGTVRVRGFELQGERRLSSKFSLAAAYQFTSSIVTDFESDPSLIGLRVPQVPRHSFSFTAGYDNPRIVAVSLQGRAVGREFDNDRNTLPLDRYFTLGAQVSRDIVEGVALFAAAENLLNSRYAIGRTPVTTIAAPAQVRVGLRIRISRAK